ncbi:MAG: hypothetical protein R3B82_29385 [Sandaracinaceae bacterium]
MPRRLALASGLACVLVLGSAALPACVLELDEGITVELMATFDAASGASADGAALRLDEARLHVEDAQLVPCVPELDARVLEALGPSRVFAHHAVGDPLAASAPHVIALGAGDSLGAMRPPAGRYCALRVTVTPSAELDDDALVARGTWERGGARGTLELRAPGQRQLDLSLEPPLAVDASTLATSVELVVDLPGALGAHSVVDRDPFDLGLDVMVDLGAALRARVLR